MKTNVEFSDSVTIATLSHCADGSCSVAWIGGPSASSLSLSSAIADR